MSRFGRRGMGPGRGPEEVPLARAKARPALREPGPALLRIGPVGVALDAAFEAAGIGHRILGVLGKSRAFEIVGPEPGPGDLPEGEPGRARQKRVLHLCDQPVERLGQTERPGGHHRPAARGGMAEKAGDLGTCRGGRDRERQQLRGLAPASGGRAGIPGQEMRRSVVALAQQHRRAGCLGTGAEPVEDRCAEVRAAELSGQPHGPRRHRGGTVAQERCETRSRVRAKPAAGPERGEDGQRIVPVQPGPEPRADPRRIEQRQRRADRGGGCGHEEPARQVNAEIVLRTVTQRQRRRHKDFARSGLCVEGHQGGLEARRTRPSQRRQMASEPGFEVEEIEGALVRAVAGHGNPVGEEGRVLGMQAQDARLEERPVPDRGLPRGSKGPARSRQGQGSPQFASRRAEPASAFRSPMNRSSILPPGGSPRWVEG